jgi:hypothetical protein
VKPNTPVVIYRTRQRRRTAFVNRRANVSPYTARPEIRDIRAQAVVSKNKMPDVDLVNRHPALQSMCSKD